MAAPIKQSKRIAYLMLGFGMMLVLLGAIYFDNYRQNIDKKLPTKDQKAEMVALQDVVKQADRVIKTDGYIEQHITYKQSYDVGYDGRIDTLLPAASNYYATSFDLHKFDDAKKALGTIGYTKEYGDGKDGAYLFPEANDLKLGQVTRCLRKENKPKPPIIVCLSLSKEPKTRDYIGGANSKSYNSGFHNSVDISKPYNLIISAQYYQ